jgi:predicted lipoprotein with Yx(FWY)xxD motif
MNNDFSVFPNASFPVYSETTERNGEDDEPRDGIGCRGICAAVPWPPVLTSGAPLAGPGIDPYALGTIVRPDGTRQVTYKGKPVYLFFGDAYISGITGTQGIYGRGKSTPWGVFNTISPQP